MDTALLIALFPKKFRNYALLTILLLASLTVTGCAVGAAPPAVVCTALNQGIYTMRLAGSIFIVLTVVLVAIGYLGQKIMKTQVAIGGAVVTLIVGVVMIVAAPAITSTFLTAGGSTMPDIVTLCSIT